MTLLFAIQKTLRSEVTAHSFTFFVCIIYPQYKYAYVHNYSALAGVFVQTQTRIYNLIASEASLLHELAHFSGIYMYIYNWRASEASEPLSYHVN